MHHVIMVSATEHHKNSWSISPCSADHVNMHPTGKTHTRLSGRLTSLNIMGARLSTPFKPLNMIVLRWFEVFQEGFQLNAIIPRDARLSDSYASDRSCFFSPDMHSTYLIQAQPPVSLPTPRGSN